MEEFREITLDKEKLFRSTLKGLSAYVYKTTGLDGLDCTNGGISSRHDRLIILPTESIKEKGIVIPRIFNVDVNYFDGIYLFYRKQFGDLIASYEDYGKGPWYMFGGNFLWSSDGRFPSKNPIKIFDRRE